MQGDYGTDTTLLTYQELAARLGIDIRSARRRVLRSGWARMPGNDGRARVAVPVSILPTIRTDDGTVDCTDASAVGISAPTMVSTTAAAVRTHASATVGTPSTGVVLTRADLDRLMSQVETAQALLREQLQRAEVAERERAQTWDEAAGLRERLGHAEGEVAALRDAVEREATRADAERTARQVAEAARDAARSEVDGWTAGGPLARAWRAFLNRRGRA